MKSQAVQAVQAAQTLLALVGESLISRFVAYCWMPMRSELSASVSNSCSGIRFAQFFPLRLWSCWGFLRGLLNICHFVFGHVGVREMGGTHSCLSSILILSTG